MDGVLPTSALSPPGGNSASSIQGLGQLQVPLTPHMPQTVTMEISTEATQQALLGLFSRFGSAANLLPTLWTLLQAMPDPQGILALYFQDIHVLLHASPE
eukprot:15342382-Ditylum_brightwellii.AAC.1